MIIWGSRMRQKKIGEGTFHCPNCRTNRRYHHKQARRYFTLYFIPIIPLKKYGEYVECQFCAQTFDVRAAPQAAISSNRGDTVPGVAPVPAVASATESTAQPALLASQDRPAKDAHSMMNWVKPRLKNGYPVEYAVRDLTTTKIDRSDALQAIKQAIGSERKTCPTCSLSYASHVTQCYSCSRPLP